MNLTCVSTNTCVRPIFRKPALQHIPAHQCIYPSTRLHIWCLFCLLPCGSLRAVIDIYSQTQCHWLQYGLQARILSPTVIFATSIQKPGILWSQDPHTFELHNGSKSQTLSSCCLGKGLHVNTALLKQNSYSLSFFCIDSELIECCLVL